MYTVLARNVPQISLEMMSLLPLPSYQGDALDPSGPRQFLNSGFVDGPTNTPREEYTPCLVTPLSRNIIYFLPLLLQEPASTSTFRR